MQKIHLFVGSLIAAMAIAAEAEDVPEPVIPPGYQPELSSDELGLWMEMQDYEERLARSPLRMRDEAVNDRIQGIACRVAADYCDDIRVYVIRNPGFNASMAPNGMMQVWSGLLTRVNSDDELAVILGHEIAHFTLAHSIARWRKAKREMATGMLLSFGISVATGGYVSLPIGETLALLSSLAYSRSSEEEADLLGTKMIADAGLDAHAAYRVWENLVREEQRAVIKGDDPSAILRTHPESEERAATLRAWTLSAYGPPPAQIRDADYIAFLTTQYMVLMDDHLDTNRYGRMQYLLEQHAESGVDPALVHFFYGEMYRRRDGDGDRELARNAYRLSLETGSPPAEAYRNLGYLMLKQGDRAAAAGQFQRYLETRPDADDRAMIELYLTDEPAP